jgi:hypothetical protein
VLEVFLFFLLLQTNLIQVRFFFFPSFSDAEELVTALRMANAPENHILILIDHNPSFSCVNYESGVEVPCPTVDFSFEVNDNLFLRPVGIPFLFIFELRYPNHILRAINLTYDVDTSPFVLNQEFPAGALFYESNIGGSPLAYVDGFLYLGIIGTTNIVVLDMTDMNNWTNPVNISMPNLLPRITTMAVSIDTQYLFITDLTQVMKYNISYRANPVLIGSVNRAGSCNFFSFSEMVLNLLLPRRNFEEVTTLLNHPTNPEIVFGFVQIDSLILSFDTTNINNPIIVEEGLSPESNTQHFIS